MKKILVLEDEAGIRSFVVINLRRSGYEPVEAATGEEALRLLSEHDDIGLALLDVMLPDIDGFTLCQKIREAHLFPILMLTARVEDMDKIMGLTLGADDYLTKPFSTGELLARIRALTRRKGEVEVDCLHFAELQLNRQTYDLIQGENRMKLSLKEYQIMEMLLSNPEQIIPKERFIEKIWGYESDVEYNNIEVYISFLRKKLTAIHSTVQIRTARGIGYFLEKKA